MSGYFGMVREDGKAVDDRMLQRLVESLKFRGPHGSAIWTKGSAGGCFTLLRTGSTTQASRHPVEWAERYYLLGDVRLDGRRELLQALSAAAPREPADATGEELLLRAWQKWGEASLQRVIGDFSFGLWDSREDTFCGARDFVGARPFYYAYTGGMFCFSNTLQILRAVPELSGDLDEVFIGDFLLDGWCQDPERTVYRDIRRLPPGHLLRYSSGCVQVTRFRKLPVEEPLQFKKPEEYLDAYRALLQEAVSDRLPPRAALYLSGGLDSGSVCAVAANLARQRGQQKALKAFTLSWASLFPDQEPFFARQTAAHLHVEQEVLEDPEMVPYAGDWQGAASEPTNDIFSGSSRKNFRRVAAHAPVVLSGDGGDNVLMGQAWPYLVYLRKRGQWMEIARVFGTYVLTHGRIPPLRGGFRTRLQQWFERHLEDSSCPAWLNEEFVTRTHLMGRRRELQHRQQRPEHPLHPRAYKALHEPYWGSVLEAEDAGWTGALVEPRAPLLDLRVLVFLLRLPPVPWCVNKELTRRALKGRLPDRVLRRPKTPLPRDPLRACIDHRNWAPDSSFIRPESILRFVKWETWQATISMNRGSLSWNALAPLSLAYWLKSVENDAIVE